MRAVGFDRNGGPEVLRLLDLPDPRPGPGQVLIRVAYAGVNFAEVYQRIGVLGAVTGMTVPGLEVSGHVLKVGAGVDGVAEGDPVAALTHRRAGASGGYADLAVAPADLVYLLRDEQGREIDLRAGAALPCMVTTGYGLLEIARLREGERVLVHAAVGGVGSAVAQLARVFGADRVLGTVGSEGKLALAAQYGYDEVHLRERFASEIVAEHGERCLDVVLDSVAGAARAQSLQLLAPLGRLVVFGNAGREQDIDLTASQLWLDSRAVLGYNIGEIAMRAPLRLRRQALAARDLMAAGRVRVDVAKVRPLHQAAQIHRELESATTHGKLLLEVRA